MPALDRCFAIFDDEVHRLKVVRMSEIHPDPEMVIALSPYAEAIPTNRAKVVMSRESEPMLRRVPLAEGRYLYLWRSPWCMYHPSSKCWIAILDSDKRDSIPGDFIYDIEHDFKNSLYTDYNSLHSSMMAKVDSLEKEATTPFVRIPSPSAPPALPDRKPPTFVAAIIKRDAIANRMVCSISLEDITEKMKTGITPCFHLFEGASLMRWISLKGFCPTCMAGVTEDDCLLL